MRQPENDEVELIDEDGDDDENEGDEDDEDEENDQMVKHFL